MNLLTLEKVTKSYTERILLDKVTFGLEEGDKVGIIGINGTGKSTLLKIIAGIENPDEGTITSKNKIKIEYLSQTPCFDNNLSILENIVLGKQKQEEYWNIEGQASAMLSKLGIEEQEQNISLLSGGQRKRVALVKALLSPADILVLDEPTNHLDNEMAQWLEEYLKKYQGAFIMVTHDRYFLDRVSNKIIEIEKGKIYTYQTNYSGFLTLKMEREKMEIATERKKKSLYQKDLEWIMRGAKARSTKQKAHIQRFEELKNREKPEEKKEVKLQSFSSRLGKTTIELSHIFKSYYKKILIQDFTYIFLKRDRIGIVGKNGCGKTTLLKIISGLIIPDKGTVEVGQTVKIGYFSQENEKMDENLSVIEYIRNVAEYIETKEGIISAAKMLERFLFFGSIQYTKIEKLSGGEKRRLYLLHVLMDTPNILILDEPTNDLDIPTLSILEDYLDDFAGIVIAVSHDRYFLDRVAQRIFAFEENGNIVQYEGGFADYQIAYNIKKGQLEQKPEKKERIENVENKKIKTEKLKFNYYEQKEYETIDEIISELEREQENIEKEIEIFSSDYFALNKLIEKKQKIEKELEEKTERWIYLNELAEKIDDQKRNK